jgi:phosphatidate cytidylyltransferase
MLAVVSVIAVVKAADVGAYVVGKLIGTHKMSPTISPGKTWEGAGGAVFFGCVASILTIGFFGESTGDLHFGPNIPEMIVYGLSLSGAGMLGDLAESLLKRDASCKDSSAWVPGMGGILDILDSILFAAPVAYVCWTILLAPPAWVLQK